jgi:outer membrane protein OmpA-like peptidoglycan-associated protein
MARAPDIAREKGLPTIDIEVLFEYDSAAITPAAAEGLMTLGRALADPRLAGGRFVIAGHTDAKGASGYNRNLSHRRAEAVRGFLIENFKLPREALIARGFGETRLKNPANPLGPENRRVQVINWTSEVQSARRR